MSGHRTNHYHVQSNPGVKTIDLDQIWGDLKRGIDQVYNRQHMPKPRYIELYTYPFLLKMKKYKLLSYSSVIRNSLENVALCVNRQLL